MNAVANARRRLRVVRSPGPRRRKPNRRAPAAPRARHGPAVPAGTARVRVRVRAACCAARPRLGC